MEQLYQITSSYFCAGIITKNKIIIKAAPIIKWTVGKSISEIIIHCTKKDWKISCIFNHSTWFQCQFDTFNA